MCEKYFFISTYPQVAASVGDDWGWGDACGLVVIISCSYWQDVLLLCYILYSMQLWMWSDKRYRHHHHYPRQNIPSELSSPVWLSVQCIQLDNVDCYDNYNPYCFYCIYASLGWWLWRKYTRGGGGGAPPPNSSREQQYHNFPSLSVSRRVRGKEKEKMWLELC